ncbi:hypothetical protein K438DRAFT_1785158 [Mycena galopus ATCC 62051]|nr:hypothetical protein K438DRAFT_1785158 [Mycena galopus ATCC 62051]
MVWIQLGNYKQGISACQMARDLLALCDHNITNQQAEIYFGKSEYREAHNIQSQILRECLPHWDFYNHGLALLNLAEIGVAMNAPKEQVQQDIESAKKRTLRCGGQELSQLFNASFTAFLPPVDQGSVYAVDRGYTDLLVYLGLPGLPRRRTTAEKIRGGNGVRPARGPQRRYNGKCPRDGRPGYIGGKDGYKRAKYLAGGSKQVADQRQTLTHILG